MPPAAVYLLHCQVGKLYFDITHYDTNMVQHGDIRQQFTLKACGSTTFPTKLAAGAVLKW
jgi:hypothetical protein